MVIMAKTTKPEYSKEELQNAESLYGKFLSFSKWGIIGVIGILVIMALLLVN